MISLLCGVVHACVQVSLAVACLRSCATRSTFRVPDAANFGLRLTTAIAAQVQQSTLVKNKDIRKFLDGIYVSEKGHVEE